MYISAAVNDYFSHTTRFVFCLSAALMIWLTSMPVVAADFREASWGMTLRDVLALHEGEIPADRRIGYVAYEAKLANLDVYIFYRLDEEGLLHQAGYEVTAVPEEGDAAIADYEQLNALLRKRYPEAAAPVQNWRNRLFESKPEEWGRAVRVGHMAYEWEHVIPRTKITHTLSGNRREMSHILMYEDAVEDSEQGVLDQL